MESLFVVSVRLIVDVDCCEAVASRSEPVEARLAMSLSNDEDTLCDIRSTRLVEIVSSASSSRRHAMARIVVEVS